MAPAAVLIDSKVIRVYCGGWDENGISRIGYIDVDANCPSKVLNVSERPVLDIGIDGAFDENGVFPGHVYRDGNKILLYYTGFQLGHKIRHYNFGGLAISEDGGNTFSRASQAPVIDRADEGLFVRAGQSIVKEEGIYHSCYSAGSGWTNAGGKPRPTYDVYYQNSREYNRFSISGRPIVECDHSVEHGLGRPQLVNIKGNYLVFYTRRVLDMKYSFGCAISQDLNTWERVDSAFETHHGKDGEFDSEMVYFPCVLSWKNKIYIFYSGNGFGKEGLGYGELEL